MYPECARIAMLSMVSLDWILDLNSPDALESGIPFLVIFCSRMNRNKQIKSSLYTVERTYNNTLVILVISKSQS